MTQKMTICFFTWIAAELYTVYNTMTLHYIEVSRSIIDVSVMHIDQPFIMKSMGSTSVSTVSSPSCCITGRSKRFTRISIKSSHSLFSSSVFTCDHLNQRPCDNMLAYVGAKPHVRPCPNDTQTISNNIIYLSPEDEWKHVLYAAILTLGLQELGFLFRNLAFRFLGF